MVLMTLSEAQRKFGVSRVTLRRAINRGEIKIVAQNKNATYVKPEDVRRWVEKFYNREMAERVKKRWQRKKPKIQNAKQ